jgi:glycerate 2-kinase
VRVVLAPDSFKGSLSAAEVCASLALGVRRAVPAADVVAVPMADGGEGTLDCLTAAWGGTRVAVTVPGPQGEPVAAHYGRSADGRTAVVELAVASGLGTGTAPRDPLRAGTRGSGELVAHAVRHGAEEVLLCLGGTATTDGGTGLLRALGFRFLDAAGRELPEGGGALSRLHAVDDAAVPPAVRAARVRLACDVTSPLTGPAGAAHVFGPQKGADPAQVEQLDAGLRRLAAVLRERYGVDVEGLPGAGAAGGTAGGVVAALGGSVERGAELVADAAGLPAALAGADLVLTGEGRLDAQSAAGKVVAVVAQRARRAGVDAVALCGAVVPPLDALHRSGLTAAFSAAPGPASLDELVAATPVLLASLAEQVVRLGARHRAAPTPLEVHP